MSFEIELKAHLNDGAPIEQRLSAWGTYCRSYTKSDSYWIPAQGTGDGSLASVRVRREKGIEADGSAYESVLVTYKHKTISDGLEVNDEREFTVSNAVLFEELLGRLGLGKAICKEKQGKDWIIPAPVSQPHILAELSLVTGLGWFLELEIIAGDNDTRTVAESRNRLIAALEKLEIPAEWIEARPYTEMLQEINKGTR